MNLKIVLCFCFLSILSSNARSVQSRAPGVGRIIGGTNISITQAPYILQLEVDGWLTCGASIIGNFFALTSASCVDGYDQRQLTLRAGSDRQAYGGQVHQVFKINIHPSYDDYFHDYDVAILEVATPFRLDATRQPLSLPSSEAVAGSTATAAGWGRTTDEGSNVNQLRSVDIPVVARHNCTAAYSGDVSLRMICAGATGRDACVGDTGGPLVQAGSTTQVGITSWSYGCALEDYPAVYTNLANTEIAAFIRSIANI